MNKYQDASPFQIVCEAGLNLDEIAPGVVVYLDRDGELNWKVNDVGGAAAFLEATRGKCILLEITPRNAPALAAALERSRARAGAVEGLLNIVQGHDLDARRAALNTLQALDPDAYELLSRMAAQPGAAMRAAGAGENKFTRSSRAAKSN